MGERVALSLVFTLNALIFLGYILVTDLPVLFVLFVIDQCTMGFHLALTTYFQKIAVTPEEITSNVSLQQTLVHLAAVVVPVVGGAVWEMFGRQVPFIAGIFITLAALALTQFIRFPPSSPAESPAAVRFAESPEGVDAALPGPAAEDTSVLALKPR